ncbi:MAG: hypothetical protein NTV23_13750 [Propionibacteriales bacterium]|nr:hypothetical protein [Propionibacteriales bacterium]
MSTLFYSVYGLTFCSEIELTDLGEPLPGPVQADVRIRIAPLAAPPADVPLLDHGLWRSGDTCGVAVPDVARYEVRAGSEIVVDPVAGADPAAVRLFLLGSMMGALMMQRDHLVLHGNAVRIGDACAVVVGRSGAGKSTLAAEFARRGLDVLSDDVVPVDRTGMALTGYPRIKLWDDALERLGVDKDSLERIHTSHEKFQLPVRRSRSEPVRLRWIYVLERHEGDALTLAPVHGALTFSLLHEHTYRNELVHGPGPMAQHLEQCARLVSAARVTRVCRPVATMTAEDTAEAILQDIARDSQESA